MAAFKKEWMGGGRHDDHVVFSGRGGGAWRFRDGDRSDGPYFRAWPGSTSYRQASSGASPLSSAADGEIAASG